MRDKLIINLNKVDLSPVLAAVAELKALISSTGALEMAVLDDLEAKVTAVQGVEASAATLLQTIHDELVAAIAANDPTRIQAVVDKLGTSSDALAAAVAANPAIP